MKKWWLVIFFLSNCYLFAQEFVKGTITDEQANSLLGVSVYYKNTTQGVTTNSNGEFQINRRPKDTLVIQYLGFKSQEVVVATQKHLEVQLEPQSVQLNQVILESKEDPAYAIIRKAIAKRNDNKNRINSYEASFYSRGVVEAKVDSVFLKRIGKQKELEEEDLKDTIVPYLSETISTIYLSPPDNFFEKITGSKVSGEETIFSYNSAEQAEMSFYENSMQISHPITSPIAHNALQLYEYHFEGDFYQDKQLINKISIRPKRSSSRVWSGTIYIVDDTSEFYGIDVEVDANVLQIPLLKSYRIKQSFVYNGDQEIWIKNLQEINFEGGLFKTYFSGRFIAHYKDYKFGPSTHQFSRERMLMLPDAIKSDSFWEEKRPVPLTNTELKDYRKKDSIRIVETSKTYLDSVDRKSNKPNVLDIVKGYTYKNSVSNWRLHYGGLINSPGFYNTVQGLSLGTNLVFTKYHSDDQTNYTTIRADFDHGVSDKRTRVFGHLTRKLNAVNNAKLELFGGTKTSQFNRAKSIKPLWNSLYTIIDNRNYMKLYDLGRYGASYSQEIINGITLHAETAWERRSPLYNTKIREKYSDRLTSNNPLEPEVEDSAPFDVHSLLRTKLGFQVRFAQDYYTHPNRKIITAAKGPVVYFGMIAGTFSSDNKMDFLQLQVKARQIIRMGQIGSSDYMVHAGTFATKNKLSFADFQHFTGNETFIAHNTIESFHLLPYYKHSTDESYLALHWEHNFKDAIMRKIPIIRALNLQLVAGANFLAVKEQKPYTEWHIGLANIGIKSWRLLRLDFVQSYSDKTTHSGVRVGIGL